jgi:predicted RNA-binding protein with PUA-like domain
MNYWLFKSEPDEYSIEDLKRDKKCLWEGVRNYQARNIMRDKCQEGDIILYYHSSTKHTGIYGLAEVSKTGVADPSQFNKKSSYFDEKSTKENPRWICVEVKFKEILSRPLLREELKENKKLGEMMLLKKGSRLSIQPVTENEFNEILKMSKKKPA